LFAQIMLHGWSIPTQHHDTGKNLGAKFKTLRRVLRERHKQISNLPSTIASNKELILVVDTLEEFQDLYLKEWNFRDMLKATFRSIVAPTKCLLETFGTLELGYPRNRV
jgi:hypothetical protein